MAKLPVTVVVPHVQTRKAFFENVVRPSIESNLPEEIIVIHGDRTGPQVARNQGLERAKTPFVFFCDDDGQLMPGAFALMLQGLQATNADFAYSDYRLHEHKAGQPVDITAGEFSADRLRSEPYIHTMSMVARERALPWDPNIRRFQNWDYWLSMLREGRRAVYVPATLFVSHRFDSGIAETWTAADWKRVVREKHGLPVDAE